MFNLLIVVLLTSEVAASNFRAKSPIRGPVSINVDDIFSHEHQSESSYDSARNLMEILSDEVEREYEGTLKHLPESFWKALEKNHPHYEVEYGGTIYDVTTDKLTHEKGSQGHHIYRNFFVSDGLDHVIICNPKKTKCTVFEEKHALKLSGSGGNFAFEEEGTDDFVDDNALDEDEELGDDRRSLALSRQLKGTGKMSGADCFSSIATLQTEGSNEPTKMKDIRIGDKVLTPSGQFETVYGWSHIEHEIPTNYLKIVTDQGNALEITAYHYMYVDGVTEPIPAGRIKVGDTLAGVDNQVSAGKVVKIEPVSRPGKYIPLTTSGKLVVDGIAASCYATINKDLNSFASIGSVNTPFTYHDLGHIWFTPYRLTCTKIAPWMCKGGTNNNEMPSWFVDFTVNQLGVIELFTNENVLIHGAALLLGAAPFLVSMIMLEFLFAYQSVVVLVVVGAFLARHFRERRNGASKSKVL